MTFVDQVINQVFHILSEGMTEVVKPTKCSFRTEKISSEALVDQNTPHLHEFRSRKLQAAPDTHISISLNSDPSLYLQDTLLEITMSAVAVNLQTTS